jgi:cobalt-zinc-cadmium efflux system outer membrane protein
MGLRLALLLLAASARAEPLRLSEVLAHVEERGPDQAAAAGQLDVAAADLRTARMWPNPGLVVSAGRAEPVFYGGLQLRLPIFGQYGARAQAGERALQQTAAEVALARWRLRHDARLAYYASALADEEVAIVVEAEALSRRMAEMAHEKFEVGTGTRLDDRQSALVNVRAVQEVSDRRAAARIARLGLARLMGAAADQLGAPADALATVGATPPLEALLQEARARHPELRALEAARLAANARARAARADRRPAPTLELGLEVLDPSTCGNEAGPRCVGPRGALGFELPLFNLNGGPIARAEAEARVAELLAHAAATRIEAAVRAAYESWAAATARAHFFDAEYVPGALAVEAMAREGFAVGKTGLLPLIEAQRAVLAANLGRAEALYSVQAARADLEEASGVTLSAP